MCFFPLRQKKKKNLKQKSNFGQTVGSIQVVKTSGRLTSQRDYRHQKMGKKSSNRDEFLHSVAEIYVCIVQNLFSPKHRALNPERKVAIALYYPKVTGSQKMTVNSFGVA